MNPPLSSRLTSARAAFSRVSVNTYSIKRVKVFLGGIRRRAWGHRSDCRRFARRCLTLAIGRSWLPCSDRPVGVTRANAGRSRRRGAGAVWALTGSSGLGEFVFLAVCVPAGHASDDKVRNSRCVLPRAGLRFGSDA